MKLHIERRSKIQIIRDPQTGEYRWQDREKQTSVCFDCEITINDDGEVMLPQDRETLRSREFDISL